MPDFDAVVTRIGGESNAMTNNDFTNYYITVPNGNLETALWLEADRMRQLDFSQRSLEVQQSVVTEEYNYRYVNQPYGDMWMLLRPLCYKVHPYRWCTIGSDIRHVQDATLADVESFFYRYYRPNNAIISIVGNVRSDEVAKMVEKLFGDISAGDEVTHILPQEPEQRERRRLIVQREVPSNALYLGYHVSGRKSLDFRVVDLISDILSNGTSSRLLNELVKKNSLFTEIDAYVTGDEDPGLFVVSGKMVDGVGFDEAIQAVEYQLQCISREFVSEQELIKVVNKYEATFAFSQYKAIDCAMALCYYERLGHLDWINEEPDLYRQSTTADIQRVASSVFRQENQSAIEYSKVN